MIHKYGKTWLYQNIGYPIPHRVYHPQFYVPMSLGHNGIYMGYIWGTMGYWGTNSQEIAAFVYTPKRVLGYLGVPWDTPHLYTYYVISR